jgi:hypothetical protein
MNEVAQSRQTKGDIMDQWFAARREALFRKTGDGFFFRFGKSTFLVNEAQKSAILKIEGRALWQVNYILFAIIGMMQIANGIAGRASGNPDALVNLITGVWVIVGLVLLVLRGPPSGQMFNEKQVRPLLVGARYTQNRITWREQNITMAKMMTMTVPLLRGAATLVCAAISLFAIMYVEASDFTAPWHLVVLILMWVAMLVASGAVAFQFFYIALLKGRSL